MMANTKLTQKDGKHVITYEYDGLKIWKENVLAFERETNTSLADVLTKMTAELTGYELEWVNKPLTEKYNISDFKPIDETPKCPVILTDKDACEALLSLYPH
jgi:hypothetical protein